jgi:hypothetical protein
MYLETLESANTPISKDMVYMAYVLGNESFYVVNYCTKLTMTFQMGSFPDQL